MADNFNLGANEDAIEELLAVVPEEWTHEELLELDQECTAEEEAREKEKAGKEKEDPSFTQTKFTLKGLAEAFSDLDKLLNSLKT